MNLKASCVVLYPPLRGIVQLTNSNTLRFRNWSFTIIKERFVLKKIAIEKISELATVLMEKGTLWAPVKEVSGHNFKEIGDPKQVDLDFYNTIISPKGAFFPHK